ncbi:hypothetical protein EV401DRAFT_1145902 [Pisolithus croceorrhizus]|nr:hypothetical protein EV401DRAFT_1145902 [Pisolithus croceorrhizus]
MQSDKFAYEPFVRVNPRKKRRGKTNKETLSPLDLLRRTKEDLYTDGTWISDCEERLRFALCDMCIKPRKVLCLGLGSPSGSRDTRAQLALLSRLCSFADIGLMNVCLYDPVFTDADKDLFRVLGMKCIDDKKNVQHSLDCPTILYMPHCDLVLYETVLRANWSRERLCNMVLVANSFYDYLEHNAISKLEAEYPCLTRLAPVIESCPLPASELFSTAFNNLSVQYAKRTILSSDDTFWELPLARTLNTVIGVNEIPSQDTDVL